MDLAEVRTTVKLLGGANGDDWEDADIDRVFRNIATEYIKRTRALDESVTITLTANDPATGDISGTASDFLAERVTAAEIGYVDKSTWLTATAYVVRDIVQGDGTPDSFLYACTTAHTSAAANEPPNGSFWSQVFSKLGTVVYTNFSYFEIRQFLTTEGQEGVPERLGFETNVKGYVYPTPDLAYPLVIKYWKPLQTWTIGTGSTVTLTLANEYIEPLLPITAAVLDSPNPHALSANAEFLRFIGEQVPSDRGRIRKQTISQKHLQQYKDAWPTD